MAIISVVGAGYVGLVTGACLAELGHTVTCIEINPDRLALLQRGESPIYEPRLQTLMTRQRLAGRLRFTASYADAIPHSPFVFIAVNTPPRPDGTADTSFVFAAARSILACARLGTVIITKSTVPVGTGDALAEMAAAAPVAGVEVVSNPEFLREGRAIRDFMEPDRIVIGAEDADAAAAVAGLYASLDAPVVVCSRRSAEIAKYAANALLAARISFMNEIAAVCEAAGADIEDVRQIVGADARIGPAFLRAGLGWGGSCFPKDVRALAAIAAGHGRSSPILHAVFDVNARQRRQALDRLLAALEGVHRPAVGVLGLAFKPDTDDIRESPAIEIIRGLTVAGVEVRAHDPEAMTAARRELPAVRYCEDPHEVADGADALLLATEWAEYLELDWSRIARSMRGRVVLDGRNVLDPGEMTAFGFTYLSFGRAAGRRLQPRRSLALPNQNGTGRRKG